METKAKLLDQMRHVLRLKHMSIRTEEAPWDPPTALPSPILRRVTRPRCAAPLLAPRRSGGTAASPWAHV